MGLVFAAVGIGLFYISTAGNFRDVFFVNIIFIVVGPIVFVVGTYLCFVSLLSNKNKIIKLLRRLMGSLG